MEQTPEMPKSRLEEAKEIISGARNSLEEEFARTNNNWVSCAKSIVFVLEMLLGSPRAKIEIGEDKYNLIDEKLEKLKIRLRDLQVEYPEKEDIPPEAVQEEVFSLMKVI